MLPEEAEIIQVEAGRVDQIPVDRMVALAAELMEGGYEELGKRAFAIADVALRCARAEVAKER